MRPIACSLMPTSFFANTGKVASSWANATITKTELRTMKAA